MTDGSREHRSAERSVPEALGATTNRARAVASLNVADVGTARNARNRRAFFFAELLPAIDAMSGYIALVPEDPAEYEGKRAAGVGSRWLKPPEDLAIPLLKPEPLPRLHGECRDLDLVCEFPHLTKKRLKVTVLSDN